MNSVPPNIVQFRPPTSGLPQSPPNTVGTQPNFHNMHQPVRTLGPPNVQSPNASQPHFMQGPGAQGYQLGSPPSNSPSNYSAVNGQGMRPQMPTAGIGNA